MKRIQTHGKEEPFMKNVNITFARRTYLPVPSRERRLWKTKVLCRHLGIDPVKGRTDALHAATQFQKIAVLENIPLSYTPLAYKACLLRDVGRNVFSPQEAGLSGEILLTHPLKDLSPRQNQILAAALCLISLPVPCPKQAHPYLKQLCPGRENRRIASAIASAIRATPSAAVQKDFSSMVKDYFSQQIAVIQTYSIVEEPLSAEGVHDIRVAFRRLLSLCLVFSSLMEDELLNAIVPGLRHGLKVLGKPRDLDVLQQKVVSYLSQNSLDPESIPSLFQWLEDTRKGYSQKIASYFASPKYHSLIDTLSNLENTTLLHPSLEKGCMALPMTPFDIYRSCAQQLLFKSESYNQWLHGQQVPEPVLHHLRLVYKDLRFLLEFFRNILTQKGQSYLKSCCKIQDALGCLHDDSVILFRLNKLFPQLPAGEQDVLKGFLRWLKLDRKKQLKNFYRLFRAQDKGGSFHPAQSCLDLHIRP